MTPQPSEAAPLADKPAWLRSLDDIQGADLALVGGKAFRLALLRQRGLNVLPGLVLTTVFFEAQLHYHHLIPLWAGSPDIAVTPEALNWLADALKLKPLSRDLAQALNQQLTACLGQAEFFAVRSSVIDEDQRDHTFAGIHLTELGVPRSALPIAITRCWASALSKPAIEYRQSHGMSIQSIRLAVLIQPMLKPQCAGVGFTVNPLTGSRDELVIEATWGLGQAVVSSQTQPYFYKLANQPDAYPVLEQRTGSAPPPAGSSAQTGPLWPHELAELAGQLEQIHALLGEAQDVEWARQDNAFFILQTRPVALPRPPAPGLDWLWTRGNFAEFLPDVPSPLLSSVLEHSQQRAVTFLKNSGLAVQGLGPYIKLILGRPYLNLTLLKRTITQMGVTPGHFLVTMGHAEPGGEGGPLSVDWETAWQARRAYWLILKQVLGLPRALKKYQMLVDQTCVDLDNAEADTAPVSLLNQLRQHKRLYSELSALNLSLTMAISTTTALASSLVAPLTRTPAAFISALALTRVKTFTAEFNQALLKLAHLARRAPATQAYLAGAVDNYDNYANEPALSSAFRQGFGELLAEYGRRATYEADMAWPRYAEDPAALLRIIGQYAQAEHPPHSPADKTEKVGWGQVTGQAEGLDRLLPWRRWLATWLVDLLRRWLMMREELHAARAKAMTACRGWDMALGQRWAGQGWLKQAADIFWLTVDEIERALMVEQEVGASLPAIVQARQDTYQTYARTPMPYSLNESQIASLQPGIGLLAEPSTEVMVGLPISPGQARGKVVVLRSPTDFEKVSDDIILVMPSTDPAWLPLLRLAAGLIVEMGGLLSHGSVIAREYGLPAVANIPNATQRLRTGDAVLLDGSTGVVQVLETSRAD